MTSTPVPTPRIPRPWAALALLAGLLLACPEPAEAGIVYQQLDLEVVSSSSLLSPDVSVQVGTRTIIGFRALYDSFPGGGTAATRTILGSSTRTVNVFNTGALDAGYLISETSPFAGFDFFLTERILSNGEGFSFGIFNDSTDKYLGLSFEDDLGTTLYGWVRLSETGDFSPSSRLRISGFAYDTTGAGIRAGDTGVQPVPEPSTAVAGLIGAACCLGVAWRRRARKRPEAVPV
ncbi:PEP-CTERM sorting domain-containing protein [Tautonia rosea]|uniref:PEP-CTERM sorting domain-containing protein n=1 Tax=Tautonia rosea TaxID=2728037 RepID=UPI001474A19B|nr:PEP-CTERM sorting domain-containing protein [Tautonia rosea]